MCITFGYKLYRDHKKKNIEGATYRAPTDNKDYAPKPHPINAGPEANYGPPNTQLPHSSYNPKKQH